LFTAEILFNQIEEPLVFKINYMCKIGFTGYVCILAWLCDYLSWFLSEI